MHKKTGGTDSAWHQAGALAALSVRDP